MRPAPQPACMRMQTIVRFHAVVELAVGGVLLDTAPGRNNCTVHRRVHHQWQRQRRVATRVAPHGGHSGSGPCALWKHTRRPPPLFWS